MEAITAKIFLNNKEFLLAETNVLDGYKTVRIAELRYLMKDDVIALRLRAGSENYFSDFLTENGFSVYFLESLYNVTGE